MPEKYPLKREPECGVFLWWPEDDESWIHPDDVDLFKELIPGNRIFIREDHDDDFNLVSYGHHQVRVLPAMWLGVPSEGYRLGDLVEVCSRFGKNEAFTGTVEEMLWNRHTKQIQYQIKKRGNCLPRLYAAADFRRIDNLNRVPVRPEMKLKNQSAAAENLSEPAENKEQ